MKTLKAIFESFPVRLLTVHIKHNQFLLIYWLILFSTVGGSFGKKIGLPYLFLDPIYLDNVGFFSFLILGLALAGFSMAFNITSYILDGFRFPFLGTLPKPFSHYCLNNAIIPVSFLVFYVVKIIQFEREASLYSFAHIAFSIFGLLVGYAIMLTMMFLYFTRTNKDIQKVISKKELRHIRKSQKKRHNAFKRLQKLKRSRIKSSYYLSLTFKIYSTRRYERYYDRIAILSIFKQNQRNAIMLEVGLLLLVITLGALQSSRLFQIPAAASGVLLLTMIIMITGALSFWLRSWVVTAIIAALLWANVIYSEFGLGYTYPAFGLDYKSEKAEYSLDRLKELSSSESIDQSKQHWIAMLENWKAKTGEDKPRMVLVAVSGGGQRSALWTMNVLQNADSAMEGRLMNETALITGASGGLIGAAFYRDLFWKSSSPKDKTHLNAISSEILNPIIFTLLVNDVFYKAKDIEYAGQTYKRERGYEFERSLAEELGGMLDRSIMDYADAEFNGEIPALMVNPLVTNDGKKLYISPQPVSFFNVLSDQNSKIQGVDFRALLKEQQADSLRFLTALRMSATFPYITPSITLPTEPPVKIADAGISDNYGISDALIFAHVFKEWILENTSELMLLTIRDSQKEDALEEAESQSALERFFSPIQNVYSSWDKVQTIKNDQLFAFIQDQYKDHFKRVQFELITPPSVIKGGRASLSWRLTAFEKQGILDAIRSEENISRLRMLTE